MGYAKAWIRIFVRLFIANVVLQSVECIVGGTSANIAYFPYQLSVRINGRHKCGGSIIGLQWALSAAHCFINILPAEVSMRAGTSIASSGGVLVPAELIYKHPDFNAKTGDFDVALILASEIFSGPNIASIGMPIAGTPLPRGSTAVISGWGMTSESEKINPNYLQSVYVSILYLFECVRDYASLRKIDNIIFCAGQKGHDSCLGDSGGPIVVNNIQVGIISGGVGCGNHKYPGLYTNIADPRIRIWIKEIANV